MAKISTVTTLRSKRAEIISSIASYEKRLAQVRADLSHVNTWTALFEVSSKPGAAPPYVDTHSMFARGALMTSCKQARASGSKVTKELALDVMAARGLDTSNKKLAHVVATRLIHALRQQSRRVLVGPGSRR
jgi:hypothetical protein